MRKITTLLPLTLALCASAAHAVPFMAMDARALAMGGTGVAAGDFHNAPLYNPALLGLPSNTKWFALGVPVSLRIADPEDLRTALTNFNDNKYLGKFDTAVANFDTALQSINNTISTLGAGSVTATQINNLTLAKNNLAASITDLNNGFRSFSDKPAELAASGAAVLAISGHHWGAALTVDSWASGGLIGHYAKSDADTLDTIVTNLNSWTSGTTTGLPTLVNFTSQQSQSTVSLRGALVVEGGIAFGKKQALEDQEFYWGVTPKFLQISSFDAFFSGAGIDQNQIDIRQNLKKQNGYNLDTGLGYIYERNWRVGAVVKNLIPTTYKTTLNNDIYIGPALRIGGAYHTKRLTGTVDLDITENDPVGIGDKTRYLALGGEVDVWVLQLRAGARTNISNPKMTMFTAGLGLNLFLLHADLAGGYGQNEWVVAGQLGMNF
ncbi:MAG: conjugal transfer protein TraF [Pseudomonadota bacterium]